MAFSETAFVPPPSTRMKNTLACFFAGVLTALAFAGCGKLGHDKDVAAGAMDQFHERFNAGEYDKIYDTADADFQGSTTRTDFLKLLDAVHRKLGDYKNCDNHGWNTNTFNSDTTVTLHYKTTFKKGEGDEEFVYRVAGTRATLRGYHINSNALITE